MGISAKRRFAISSLLNSNNIDFDFVFFKKSQIQKIVNVFYASNKDISDFLGISKRQVIRSISKLSELGYFTIRHSKENNIPGNDIRVLERSEKYLELFTTFEKIIGSYKTK